MTVDEMLRNQNLSKKEKTLHQENQMALQKLYFSLGGHPNNSAAALTPNYPPRQSCAGSCNPTPRNCPNAKTIKSQLNQCQFTAEKHNKGYLKFENCPLAISGKFGQLLLANVSGGVI